MLNDFYRKFYIRGIPQTLRIEILVAEILELVLDGTQPNK